MENLNLLLEMKNITKSFPGVKALNDANFSLYKGEVHALVGENGAGKSTLIKILSGFYKKDKGEILFENKVVEISNPKKSIELGISIIYQEIIAVPYISVSENILLANRPVNKLGIISWKSMKDKTLEILNQLNINLPVDELVINLSTAQKQKVEIAKALSLNSKIVIMDEPSASLTKDEIKILFDIIRKIKERGVSVIYISHRLEEIFEIADRVTVLRDGKDIISKKLKDTNNDEIIKYMIGRDLENMYKDKHLKKTDKVILEIKDFYKNRVFKDINFKLYEGEILGFAGLVGSGRSELVNTIFGIIKKDKGKIFIYEKEKNIRNPLDAIKEGIGLIPEERKSQALILDLAVDQNITAASLKKISRLGFLSRFREKQLSMKYIKELNIKTPKLSQKIAFLSGGNQQKVIIARWLALNPRILILDEPTRGIDVGSKAEIHKLITEFANKGTSIIMISSEMNEVIKMCNRILVMKNGEIVNCLNDEDVNEESILRSMTGIKNNH